MLGAKSAPAQELQDPRARARTLGEERGPSARRATRSKAPRRPRRLDSLLGERQAGHSRLTLVYAPPNLARAERQGLTGLAARALGARVHHPLGRALEREPRCL